MQAFRRDDAALVKVVVEKEEEEGGGRVPRPRKMFGGGMSAFS